MIWLLLMSRYIRHLSCPIEAGMLMIKLLSRRSSVRKVNKARSAGKVFIRTLLMSRPIRLLLPADVSILASCLPCRWAWCWICNRSSWRILGGPDSCPF